MHLQPAYLSFGPQEGALYRGQFVIWPRVMIITRVEFIVSRRQHDRVIRAPDVKSGDPESRSDHILFQVMFGSNALYLRSLLLFHRQLVCQ